MQLILRHLTFKHTHMKAIYQLFLALICTFAISACSSDETFPSESDEYLDNAIATYDVSHQSSSSIHFSGKDSITIYTFHNNEELQSFKHYEVYKGKIPSVIWDSQTLVLLRYDTKYESVLEDSKVYRKDNHYTVVFTVIDKFTSAFDNVGIFVVVPLKDVPTENFKLIVERNNG